MIFKKIKKEEIIPDEYINSIYEIKSKLQNIDNSIEYISIYRIYILWCSFSDSRYANFLVITDNTINEFLEWLDEF